MTTVELEPEQALAIFSMVFAPTDAEREPMVSQLGFLEPAQREQLADHQLIELIKEKRSRRTAEYVRLTDEGWHWASEHLDAPVLPIAHAASVLHAVLLRLRAHLGSSDASLSEFATAPIDAPVPVAREAAKIRLVASERMPAAKGRKTAKKKATPAAGIGKAVKKKATPSTKGAKAAGKSNKKAKPVPKTAKPARRKAKLVAKEDAPAATKTKLTSNKRNSNGASRKSKASVKASASGRPIDNGTEDASKTKQPTAANGVSSNGAALPERIRRTCLDLAGGATRKRVRLRELRARLPDVPRERLDQELFELQRTGMLVLYRIDDPTDVSRDDEQAALHVAGSPRHILYLEH